MHKNDAIAMVIRTLNEAEAKHPCFPHDPVYAAAIIGEEAGETLQAANDLVHHAKTAAYRDASVERLLTEAAQTAAAAIRLLLVLG